MKALQVATVAMFSLAVFPLLTFADPDTAPTGLQISPTSVDFGEVQVNSDSSPRLITISNQTKGNITIEQIIASGMDFSENHDCGQALAPGAQCTIQVSFRPVIAGPRIGNLDVMGSDSGSPHFIALNGTGK